MDKFALIVAGGKGTRMNREIAKQYLLLDDKPIIMQTIHRFYEFDPQISIILVIPTGDFDLWKSLCSTHKFTIPHQLVGGGKSRFRSVQNGLGAISDQGIVAIHDGVRPLVDIVTIRNSFEMAALKGNAISAVPLKDSIRSVNPFGSKSEDRSRFRIIQTPQTFLIGQIKKAYDIEEKTEFTDDASVAEYAGFEINLIDGSNSNIKITTNEDLLLAEIILNEQKKTRK